MARKTMGHVCMWRGAEAVSARFLRKPYTSLRELSVASTRPSCDASINESVAPRSDGGFLLNRNMVVVDRRRTSQLATSRACPLASNCGRATVDGESVMPSYGEMQRAKGRSSWTRRCGSWSVRRLWERVGVAGHERIK